MSLLVSRRKLMLSYIVESFKKGVRLCRRTILTVVDVWVDIKEGLISYRDLAFLSFLSTSLILIIILLIAGIIS